MSETISFSRSLAARLRRFAAFAVFGASLPLVAPAVAALLGGCGSEGEKTTTGHRVVLATRLELEPAGESFTTPLGWSVTLTNAYVSAGVLRYFDGVPPIALGAETADRAFAARFLGLGVAHAHPGHYQAGNVLGEMLVPASVDLFAGTSALADGEGVSGVYRSARFTLGSPPADPFAAELDGHVALAEGFAEKSGEEKRWFRAFAESAEVAESAPDGAVDGCVFEEFAVEGDGTVTVRVRPSEWFTLVNFGVLDAGTEEEPSEFPAASQPRIAFAQGVAELSAYRFSFTPGVSIP